MPESYITIADVREYIFDQTPEDNLSGDLEFSDLEIEAAMRATAREYNGIDPLIYTVEPHRLSMHNNMFFDGIAAHLYKARMAQDMRSDVTYNAGGVVSSETQNRIQHFMKLVQMYGQAFRSTASKVKSHRNIRRGYGRVG